MSNGGMRRILKSRRDPVEWIRQKYTKNLYDRQGGGVGGGADSVAIMHEIFSMNPLAPELRTVPTEEKTDKASVHPLDTMIRGYVRRHDLDHARDLAREDGRRPSLRNRSVVHANAYEFALRQLRAQRDDPTMSEEESVDAVERLLREEDRADRTRSRATTTRLREEAAASHKKRELRAVLADDDDDATPPDDNTTTVPSLLHGEPKTALQLTVWGERLRAAPYARWTVGAATALDHWIATKILRMSEHTWDDLLAGRDTAGLGRASDVVDTRRALFPETLAADDEEEDEERHGDDRIDDLLASLDLGTENDVNDDQWNFNDEEEDRDVAGYRATLDTMLDQLQVYRERHVQQPYDDWEDTAKEEFKSFVQDYVSHINPTEDGDESNNIDMEATRVSLLAHPPMDKVASSSFFDKIKDETEAELFLDDLTSRYESNKSLSSGEESADDANAVLHRFMALPYRDRLERLLTIGTLRPLYDEYADSDAFLERYREYLLRGVPLPGLVEDESGAVGSEKKSFVVKDNVPYGEAQAQRERVVLQQWGEYKSSRARHEEKMFQEGKLGLEYEKKGDTKKDGDNMDKE